MHRSRACPGPAKRRAFDREFKLKVVNDYYHGGKNIAKTARNFGLTVNKCTSGFERSRKSPSRKVNQKRMAVDVMRDTP